MPLLTFASLALATAFSLCWPFPLTFRLSCIDEYVTGCREGPGSIPGGPACHAYLSCHNIFSATDRQLLGSVHRLPKWLRALACVQGSRVLVSEFSQELGA